MGWLGNSEYNCPECDGEKEVACPECGAEHECDNCDGSGWDPEQVDVPAFLAALESMHKKARDDGSQILSHEGIDHKTNTRWGSDGGKYGSVAVIDFVR